MTILSQIGPLDWRIAIVDTGGKPTSAFQRAWNKISSYNFTDLADVPNSYGGASGSFVQVNSKATGLQFSPITIPTPTYQTFGDSDFTPTITNDTTNYVHNTTAFTATRTITLTTTGVTKGTAVELFVQSSSSSVTVSSGIGTFNLTSHSRRLTAVFDGTTWQLVGTNLNV